MTLKEKVKNLPNTPGVYLMKDKDENIIYVGKSKNLKNRVSQYFTSSYNPSRKIVRMIKFIKDIEILNTDTELDALLLECDLIKKIQPMYNTLMKNDKKYSYIKINIKEEFPSVEVVYEKNDDNLYFGPYTSLNKLEHITDILIKTFKIRKCKVNNKLKGCLNYDLGICLGPCRNKDKINYDIAINNLINTLQGNDELIIKILNENMQNHIINLKFEEAKECSDNIDSIKTILNKSQTINFMKENYNTLAITNMNETKIKLYLFKGSNLIYTQALDKKNIKTKEAIKTIENTLNKYCYFSKNIDNKDTIEKEDVDISSIIYSYLNYSKECKYTILKENDMYNQIEKCIISLDFI